MKQIRKRIADREKRTMVVVRMDPKTHDDLLAIATAEDRSVNMQILRYIKRGMEEDGKTCAPA